MSLPEHGSSKSPRPRSGRITSAFKKDLKRAKSHRKCDVEELKRMMKLIENRQSIPEKYCDHFLIGRYPDRKDGQTDCRECHTSNDWLLIYRFPDDDSVDYIRTGTHSDLFG